jgi:hypothetical protein
LFFNFKSDYIIDFLDMSNIKFNFPVTLADYMVKI